MDDVKSLSQSKWRCKFRIVFAPKYRGHMLFVQFTDGGGRGLTAPKGLSNIFHILYLIPCFCYCINLKNA